MFRSILVPLDGSEASEHALGTACTIARHAGATLHLVHVHMSHQVDPIYVEGLPVIDDELHSQSEAHARTYLERLRDRTASTTGLDVTCELLPGDGSIAAVLVHDALAHDAGLIAMTTHGRGGFERAWLGSVADQLVRCSPVPLLVVRPAANMAALETFPLLTQILIPLDGSPLAESILELALHFGRLTPVHFTLLQVIEPVMVFDALSEQARTARKHEEITRRHAMGQAYLDALVRRFQQEGLQASARVIVAEHPAEGILGVARQQAIDMIAMATHGRGGLSRLLIGSVADKVLRAAECPMLLHRPEQTTASTAAERSE